MNTELKSFLLTGNLGPIHCRMSVAKAISALGEPDAKQDFYDVDGSVAEVRYGYGALTLVFQKDVVAGYGFYLNPGAQIPAVLNPVGYFPVGRTVFLSEFVNYMQSEGIPFRERKEEEDASFELFTAGDVGVGVGVHRILSCLVKMCPNTDFWRKYRPEVSPW